MKLPVSRGFLSAMGGIAITIFGWWSPWAWPAWPSLAVLPLVRDFLEPSSNIREGVVVLLIVVNVAGWGVAIRLLIAGFDMIRERRRRASE